MRKGARGRVNDEKRELKVRGRRGKILERTKKKEGKCAGNVNNLQVMLIMCREC